MKFLLDTNFLMIPGKFRVDVFRQLEEFEGPELYTLGSVLKELERLSKAGPEAKYAKIALEMAKGENVRIIFDRGEPVDGELVRLAGRGFTVCTQDRGIIRKLKGKYPVVTLRQKRYLVKL
ncbi:MAG: hypothetical protein HY367_00835 [Candidatus Aenigmarchaeota archaeon]|nr:hypothetical protein [Candidatus Aenigmarchaeota archaeon]